MKPRLTLREAITTLLCATLILATGWYLQLDRRAPNIIHIMADDLGYGELGAYGQRFIQTPNLDRMAAEGLRFDRFYAGASVCMPSRLAHLTGMNPASLGVNHNGKYILPAGGVTVARLLADTGYQTAAIGKWALGSRQTAGYPNRQGFDYWFGYQTQTAAHNYYPVALYENQRRRLLPGNIRGDEPTISVQKTTWAPDLLQEQSLAFIRKNSHRPFYLQIFTPMPHTNSSLHRLTGNGYEVPPDTRYAKEPWSGMEKDYARMVSRLDEQVGGILDLLRELDIAEHSVVFFTADNGAAGERGVDSLARFNATGGLRGNKATHYEGGLRVPMLAWWPGTIAPGQVSEHVAAGWDFLPTALDIAGAAPRAGLDGISFFSELTGLGEQRAHRALYWDLNGDTALLMHPWKLIEGTPHTSQIQLYNLLLDPGEQNNLANKPGQQRWLEAMLENRASIRDSLPAAQRTDSAG